MSVPTEIMDKIKEANKGFLGKLNRVQAAAYGYGLAQAEIEALRAENARFIDALRIVERRIAEVIPNVINAEDKNGMAIYHCLHTAKQALISTP